MSNRVLGTSKTLPSLPTDKPTENILEQVRLQAATAQAEDRSFQELLREKLERKPPSPEPTSECLTEIETLNYCEGELLPPERLGHVEHCRWCQSMLIGAIHSGEGFWQELRRRQDEAEAREAVQAHAEAQA